MNATFSPLRWAEQFRTATDSARANAMTAAGYSPRLAESCQLEVLRLYGVLFDQLAGVPVTADDLFTRPQLAAVLTAVHARIAGAPAPAPAPVFTEVETELLVLALLGMGERQKSVPMIHEHIVPIAAKLGITERLTAKASEWIGAALKSRKGGAS